MENKKYILTDDSIEIYGRKLFRIKALVSFGSVKKDDLGGYIETEKNLNADVSGDAWVSGDAQVSGNARVFGDARVFGKFKLEIGFYFGMKYKGQTIKEMKLEDGNFLIWKE